MDYVSPRASNLIMQQYAMIHDIYVLLDDGDRRVLQPFGLSMPQYRMLQCLGEEHGQRLTTLSERLLRAKSTITRIVDQLEQNGLVLRLSDDDDRRAQRVVLTPQGAEILQKAHDAHQQALIYRVEQALSEAEQAEFCALLQTLHDSLVESLDTLG